MDTHPSSEEVEGSEGSDVPAAEPSGRTFLLVDGENIDATLGNSLLGRRPAAEERPRWDRVAAYAASAWGQPVTGLFFLNASAGTMPQSFVSALLAMDYRPVPLAGRADQKVVDIGIQRTLEALAGRPGDVFLCSHDGDFVPQLAALDDGRRLGVLGLREYVNAGFAGHGIEVHDLEDQVGAFNVALPRVRIIDLDSFDPLVFLR